jgi:hypothetical protein
MMKAKIRNSQVFIDCGDALQREEAGVILMKSTNTGNGTKLARRRARREVAAGAKSNRSRK